MVHDDSEFSFMICLVQVISRYLYNNIAHTTMAMSNVIGPMEKIAMDGNPIKSFSFFVSGAPQVSKQTAQVSLAIF